MYSRDATTTFREKMMLKDKTLYTIYDQAEAITISSKDKDDVELTKRLRSDPPSPMAFASMVKVKPKVLTLEEAIEKRLRGKEQWFRLQKAIAGKFLMQSEVAKLTTLLLEQQRQRTAGPPHRAWTSSRK